MHGGGGEVGVELSDAGTEGLVLGIVSLTLLGEVLIVPFHPALHQLAQPHLGDAGQIGGTGMASAPPGDLVRGQPDQAQVEHGLVGRLHAEELIEAGAGGPAQVADLAVGVAAPP